MTTQYWFDLSSLYERRKALVYALTFQTMKGIADDYCTLYEKSKNIWSMQGIEHVQNLLRAGVGRFRFGYEQFDLLNRLDIPVLVQELNAESAGPLVERLWAVQGDGSCPEAYATQAAYETEMTSQGWPFYGRSYIHRSPSKGHRPGEKDTGHIYLEHILAHEQVEMTPRRKQRFVIETMREAYSAMHRLRSEAYEDMYDVFTTDYFYDDALGDYSLADLVERHDLPPWVSALVRPMSHRLALLDPGTSIHQIQLRKGESVSFQELCDILEIDKTRVNYHCLGERLAGTRAYGFFWHALFNPNKFKQSVSSIM